MRRHSFAFGPSLAFILTVSIIFSACDGGTAVNRDVASKPYYKPSAPMSANSNSSAGVFKEEGANGERYAEIEENPFLETARAPLSTFSIDVDTASYANVRRYLNDGQLPPKDAVRIEELVNYFEYDYPQPAGRSAVFGEYRGRGRPVEPAAQDRPDRPAG